MPPSPRHDPLIPFVPGVQHQTAELVLHARAGVGESPVWDAPGERLLWLDIPRCTLHSYHPATGAATCLGLPERVSAIALRADGGLVGAATSGFVFINEARLDDPIFVVAPFETAGALQMNDGKCDRAGRFWAGSVAVRAQDEGQAELYCLERDQSLLRRLTGVTVSNGLDWNLDDTQMYYIDSATQRVDSFAFDLEAGTISDREPLIEIDRADGSPDGMTVDSEGCLWVAVVHGGEVRRYSPSGGLLGRVTVPTSVVTSCCFGGRELTDLYITTSADHVEPARRDAEPCAGGIFACRVGVAGRRPAVYAGVIETQTKETHP